MEKSNNEQIKAILKRNQKVESDKKWETSFTRRCCIAAITFVCAYGFLKIIGADNAALAAVVPTAGFLLSTLGLKSIRNIWEKFEK